MRKCYHVSKRNAELNAEAHADLHPIVTVWFPMTVAQDGVGTSRAVHAHHVTCESETMTHWNVEKNFIETCCDGPIVIDGVRLEADEGLVKVGDKWVLPST